MSVEGRHAPYPNSAVPLASVELTSAVVACVPFRINLGSTTARSSSNAMTIPDSSAKRWFAKPLHSVNCRDGALGNQAGSSGGH